MIYRKNYGITHLCAAGKENYYSWRGRFRQRGAVIAFIPDLLGTLRYPVVLVVSCGNQTDRIIFRKLILVILKTMGSNVAEAALKLLKSYPRVAINNIKNLPGAFKKV